MSAAGVGPGSEPSRIGVQSVTQQKSPAINCSSQRMRDTDQPSLPAWIQTAYETLETAYTAETDELSREAAHEFLITETEQIETDEDATYVIDRLLDRGWLYEVDGQLRKTE